MQSETKSWKETSIPSLEEEIIRHWKEINVINELENRTKNFPEKIFLDGPPFATGTMHYGHILVSTIKDTMIRYFTMNGFRVSRGFGWDTHGVPLEMLVKKKIGYQTKKELEAFGIDRHNNLCRELVMDCANKWYKDFERIGRWIDMTKEYKTMDRNFMESVIWVFKELYTKGMIYEGYKVLPYSTGCCTALSHFESKLEYKYVTDPSVICCFEIVSTEFSNFNHDPSYPTYVLAWTTTPWTLPGNMALCTGIDMELIYAFDNELRCYILMSKSKFESYAKLKFNDTNRFNVICYLMSDDLVNAEYKPPFTYFWKDCKHLPIGQRPFRIVADHYVKESGEEAGTGFVHCFSPDTKILMEDLTVKEISKIKVGEKVWGDDNTLRTVINTIPIQKGKMYEIFQNGNDSYYVNSVHTLVLMACGVTPGIRSNGLTLYWWTKCTKKICRNKNNQCCGGIIKLSKTFDNKKETNVMFIKLKSRKLDPNIVLDGDVFEITVEQFLTLCIQEARTRLTGLHVSRPIKQIEKTNLSIPPYLLGRKQIKNNIPIQIFESDQNKFCGITVDGNQRFLLHDCTVVHNCSPSNGEEDFRVCSQNGIIDQKNTNGNLFNIIDEDGCLIPEVKDYTGMYIKKADPLIIKDLKEKGLVFDSKPYYHLYPHCYRTGTPLLHRLITAWFLNASNENFRAKMLANNKKINWIPSNIGTNDFGNWLQGSVDWCISRSRFWGTPIPVWKSDDGNESVCIGSIEELCELSGVKEITDIHIENLDKIKIPSKMRKGMLSRVEGVLDCWFESGSVPYGQIHYPFENKEIISSDRKYIADFITESKDQTRGWFYTLLNLSTALLDKPPFENVIVTGIMNGEDGEKLSKSKENFPDPHILINKYGSDILRFYLLSTPIVKAESIKFNEKMISQLQQNSIVKIYNIALLLVEKINLYNKQYNSNPIIFPSRNELELFDNILDKWIINKTGLLLKNISRQMNSYNIVHVAQTILDYIEQLTNWYVKMTRERLKGFVSRFSDSEYNWRRAIQTLLYVIYQFIRIMAPIMPFITDIIYGMIKPYLNCSEKSIHFEKYPTESEFIFGDYEEKFLVIQHVITIIREIRDIVKIPIRRPIICAQIGCINLNDWEIIQDILNYVKSESNIMHVEKLTLDGLVTAKAEAKIPEIKEYLKNIGQLTMMQKIVNFIKGMNKQQIEAFQKNLSITEPSNGIVLNDNLIGIRYSLTEQNEYMKISGNIVIKLDTTYTDEVNTEYLLRLIGNAIQEHRKKMLYKPWDIIEIFYSTDSSIGLFIEEHVTDILCENIRSVNKMVLFNDTIKSQSVHQINNCDIIIGSNRI